MKKAIATGLALLTLGGVFASAEECTEETKPVEQSIQDSQNQEIIATFQYESNRPEPEYNGLTFKYNLWNDGTISQADKSRVDFAQRWFYDIDGDGKFGNAELNAIESGKLIYMHPEFNKIANEEIKETFNSMLDLTKKVPYQTRILGVKSVDERTKQKELQKDGGLNLILRGTADTDFNNFGAGIGLQYNPVKNIGLAVLANFSKAGNENISDTQTPTFKEIYGEINKDEINSFSIGPSFELQAGPIILGAGFNYWNWIEETNEKIIKGTETVKSNINSIPNSRIFGNIYAGLEFKIKNFGFGATIGYDDKKGPYLGARTTIRLNRPRREYTK